MSTSTTTLAQPKTDEMPSGGSPLSVTYAHNIPGIPTAGSGMSMGQNPEILTPPPGSSLYTNMNHLQLLVRVDPGTQQVTTNSSKPPRCYFHAAIEGLPATRKAFLYTAKQDAAGNWSKGTFITGRDGTNLTDLNIVSLRMELAWQTHNEFIIDLYYDPNIKHTIGGTGLLIVANINGNPIEDSDYAVINPDGSGGFFERTIAVLTNLFQRIKRAVVRFFSKVFGGTRP